MVLPLPPIAADADLRDFPFMPLEVARVRAIDADLALSADEFWASIMLMCVAWHQVPAASIPADDLEISALLRVSLSRWCKIRAGALADFVKCSDGRLYHTPLSIRAAKAWAARQRILARLDRRLEIISAEWAALRTATFSRDDYTCSYCGNRGVALECDHVIPVSRGGKTEIANLTTACLSCNRSKGDKLLAEWRA